MKYIPVIILSVFLLTQNSLYAEEGSFTICDVKSDNITYDNSAGKILLSCRGNPPVYSSSLNIINPEDLNIEKSFQFNGLVNFACFVGSCSSLLVLLYETDGNPRTNESELLKLDYETGDIISNLPFNDSMFEMTLDNQGSYAYVICNKPPPPPNTLKIIKISLSNFQIIDEVIFGKFADDIEIAPDGSKIYANSINIYPSHPSARVPGIGVFRTSDMERIKRFSLPNYPPHLMEMSDDGSKLFIASSNDLETDWGADLYIIDTQTDEIAQKLRFYYNGMETATYSLAYCGSNNKLYCSAQPKTDPTYPYSNLILELDLTDYSYSFFTMGDNPLSRIALAEYDGHRRLFAIEEGTPVVHYKDLD